MIDIDRFRAGDKDYFPEIVGVYQSMVMGVARAYATDQDHADDLFQAIWVQIYRKAPSFADEGTLDGWIHRVATNTCRTDHRARTARSDAHRRFAGEGGSPGGATRSYPDPLTHASRADLHTRLHRALGDLPDRQHQAITLRMWGGLSFEEAAEAMGTSAATVRSNVRHAVRRLRELMEDSDDELSEYRSTC